LVGTNAGVNQNQHFSSIAYAASGQWLLCASRNSPYICMYDTATKDLTFRFTLTQNRSLSGVLVMLNSKDMTESGTSRQLLNVSDSEPEDYADLKLARQKDAKRLPGVKQGETADKFSAKELHVWDVAFSMDARYFAAATTQGLYVYSLDAGVATDGGSIGQLYGTAMERFVPQILTEKVTAVGVLAALKDGKWGKAMVLGLALNDFGLLVKVYESIPLGQVPVVVAGIGAPLLPALLHFLGACLHPTVGTPHVEYHFAWINAILDTHLSLLQDMNSAGAVASLTAKADMRTLFLYILQQVQHVHKNLGKLLQNNLFTLEYLTTKRGNDEEQVVVEDVEVPDQEKPEPVAVEAVSDDGSEWGDDDDEWAVPAAPVTPKKAEPKKRKALFDEIMEDRAAEKAEKPVVKKAKKKVKTASATEVVTEPTKKVLKKKKKVASVSA